MTAEENLAFDLALFRAIEAGGEADSLRLWESLEPVVVLGRSGVIAGQVDELRCSADGIPILRRDSGGGAVVLAPGCLNYSLVLSLAGRPEYREVRASYRILLGAVASALNVPGLEIRGLSDLAIGDLKVSGNAQRRGQRALLHHGTLLYAFDPELAERYLKQPLLQPAYRSDRRHAAFLGNLPLSPHEIRERLNAAFPLI